jgi:hypothetical protein
MTYNFVLNSVCFNEVQIFLLDAPGRTDKIFVTNLILSKFRSQEKLALAVALLDAAATLLAGQFSINF